MSESTNGAVVVARDVTRRYGEGDTAVDALRGGSWATDGLMARASLRRWEHPGRREIFAGFRLARDA